jgi:hypothetical protein
MLQSALSEVWFESASNFIAFGQILLLPITTLPFFRRLFAFVEAITFFRQQLMLYKNMLSPHIDPQTFLSVWLSSFFRLNFTILPKGLLFVLMSFIFST